jgi:hypothetical protein
MEGKGANATGMFPTTEISKKPIPVFYRVNPITHIGEAIFTMGGKPEVTQSFDNRNIISGTKLRQINPQTIRQNERSFIVKRPPEIEIPIHKSMKLLTEYLSYKANSPSKVPQTGLNVGDTGTPHQVSQATKDEHGHDSRVVPQSCTVKKLLVQVRSPVQAADVGSKNGSNNAITPSLTANPIRKLVSSEDAYSSPSKLLSKFPMSINLDQASPKTAQYRVSNRTSKSRFIRVSSINPDKSGLTVEVNEERSARYNSNEDSSISSRSELLPYEFKPKHDNNPMNARYEPQGSSPSIDLKELLNKNIDTQMVLDWRTVKASRLITDKDENQLNRQNYLLGIDPNFRSSKSILVRRQNQANPMPQANIIYSWQQPLKKQQQQRDQSSELTTSSPKKKVAFAKNKMVLLFDREQ